MNGFTDKPTCTMDEDAFGVRQYISGLTEFITDCNTPMTIAVQGDWGSGKTSVMNMIREQLGSRVLTSWFNTWQYSQFNMGDSLSLSFLSRLVADLETKEAQKDAVIRKTLRTIANFAKNAGLIMMDSMVGGKAAEMVENGLSQADQAQVDMPQAINELKKQFQEAVNSKVLSAGTDRIVIFIDDLDRLHPGKAVELLEVLKLFLDCDKCVFVLAIDYAVVSQGVKQKYGELIGEDKGRSFFDKIIQVPFKMPVAQYNVRDYVTKSMKALGMEVAPRELDFYVKLIQRSVGCNPRAMKRLFNAFLLLNKIAEKTTVIDGTQRKTLFAILCLQMSFEGIYNYIVENAQDCMDGTLLHSLTLPQTYTDGSEGKQLARELQLQTAAQIADAANFMRIFVSVLDLDGDASLTEEEMSAFVHTLRFSTITANAPSGAADDDSLENHYRYYNRGIIKDILVKLQGSISGDYKIYQTRTNTNPSWQRYYAGGWQGIACSFGQVNIEFKVATDLQTQQSALSVWIYPNDKTDRSIFAERLREWGEKQTYGFTLLENPMGYWLCEKTLPADARSEIIRYFADILPKITADVKKLLSDNRFSSLFHFTRS